MKQFIFNLADGDREQAISFLRAQMWPLRREDRHCHSLAPGDLVLIHVSKPRCEFIGCAELVTTFRDWTPLESEACSDGRSSGVLLTAVEEWPGAVPLNLVVQRIDPTASTRTFRVTRRASDRASFKSLPTNTPPRWHSAAKPGRSNQNFRATFVLKCASRSTCSDA